jgi:hypothetical protein
MFCFGNNSLIISAMRHWAESERRGADWDQSHICESGTTQEYECREENNRNRRNLARVLDHSIDHFKSMWGNV